MKDRKLAGTTTAGVLALVVILCLIPVGAVWGDVTPTNTWIDLYSLNSTYLGQPVPVGAQIAVFDPQGVQCGEFVVTTAGHYGIMPCYGDDLTTPAEDEGALSGDVLHFTINDAAAQTEAIALNGAPIPATTEVIWNQAQSLWQVNLHVATAPEEQCGLEESVTYDFNAGGPIHVEIVDLGSLSCLRVQHMTGSHPRATTGIATGQYWIISGTDNLGEAAAEYNLTLTLPANFTPDETDKLCRYVNTNQAWDCAASSFDAQSNTVTRANVVSLSDWAVGDDVNPNAVTLQHLRARTQGPEIAWTILALGLMGLLTKGSRRVGCPTRLLGPQREQRYVRGP